jgi:hypothetical protein
MNMRFFQAIILTIIVLLSGTTMAQTGIGTTAPVNKLEIVTTAADPLNSGTAANGNLRLGGLTVNHVLDFGLGSSSFAWIQSRNKTYGTNNNLVLNPLGGNVGIGTSAPTNTLTVGNATGTIPGELTLNPTTASFEGGQINFKKSLTGSTVDWIIDQYGSTASDARLRIFNTSDLNGLIIRENGFIGMGNTSPSVRLQVSGDIIANSIAGSSDLRFKTNVRSISSPLEKVKSLRGVYFNWDQKSFPNKDFSDKTELGFIAQEVEKVLPEVVSRDNSPEEYRSVKYDKVVALLVEAIKEQQKQIDSLKSQVKKLKRKKK